MKELHVYYILQLLDTSYFGIGKTRIGKPRFRKHLVVKRECDFPDGWRQFALMAYLARKVCGQVGLDECYLHETDKWDKDTTERDYEWTFRFKNDFDAIKFQFEWTKLIQDATL